MIVSRKMVAIALAGCMSLSSCATTAGGRTQPLTPGQKIAGCVATIAIGAIIGGVIANNSGSGNADRGIGLGAAAGAGACAVWLAFEARADRERIARLQQAAMTSGQPQSETWQNQSGKVVRYSVAPSAETSVPIQTQAGQESRQCRASNETADANGQAQSMQTLYCRNPVTQAWEPATRAPTA